MIQFIDLWRAHPFNDGGRCAWPISETARHLARAMTTALARAGFAECDDAAAEPGALLIAKRLDAARKHGFGPRETFSLGCESGVFHALFGRTGVVLHGAAEPLMDVWNGQRSATMGLARWVQLLTAQHAAPAKAPEMWFWPLPDGCGGPITCGGPKTCGGPMTCGGMELSSGT